MLRIVIFTLFVIIFTSEHALAFDLDMTVDDDIRKNYNSSKLINDTNTEELDTLPDLPDLLKNGKTPNIEKAKSEKYTAPTKLVTSGNTKISRGTSFNVTNNAQISDWQKKGTMVNFTLRKQVVNRHFAIPAGTTFTGEILESHQPQITCNGGLVVIRIRNMKYKGQTYPLNAYVTRAKDKKVFFNDIKGERKYLKTMWKKGNWGRSIFNRMLTLTINLGGESSTVLFSPFPFLYGTLCLGLNTLTSPICAFFNKGGHVNIPAGSNFRIKLLSDTYID
ncbi:hypothetical protein IKQ21_07455 [bacterium]|nr:hypothetical protein [bacterium]